MAPEMERARRSRMRDKFMAAAVPDQLRAADRPERERARVRAAKIEADLRKSPRAGQR